MASEVCPDSKFQNFVRREFTTLRACLARKISWTMLSIILAGIGILSGLVFTAYCRGQDVKEEGIRKNTEQIQELRTSMQVMQVQFKYVTLGLERLHGESQAHFTTIMQELKKIQDENSKRSRSRVPESYYQKHNSED